MMMYGRNNGKKLMIVRIVKYLFEIIYLLIGEVRNYRELFLIWVVWKLFYFVLLVDFFVSDKIVNFNYYYLRMYIYLGVKFCKDDVNIEGDFWEF